VRETPRWGSHEGRRTAQAVALRPEHEHGESVALIAAGRQLQQACQLQRQLQQLQQGSRPARVPGLAGWLAGGRAGGLTSR
jgi:hypothetical protein